jgi:hypothetical protein
MHNGPIDWWYWINVGIDKAKKEKERRPKKRKASFQKVFRFRVFLLYLYYNLKHGKQPHSRIS